MVDVLRMVGGIHRPVSIYTHSQNLEQRRAQKGGARGGKAGFATPSAFSPRITSRFEKRKKLLKIKLKIHI